MTSLNNIQRTITTMNEVYKSATQQNLVAG